MAQNVGSDGQSFKGYVGLAEESDFGSETAPNVFMDAMSEGFSGDNQPLYLSTIRGRETYKGEAGAYNDEGSTESPVTPEGALPYLLKGAFGSASVTTSDPDGDSTDEVGEHTFSPADYLPSYTFALGMGGVVPVYHTGSVIDTFTLSHSATERLTMSTGINAQAPSRQTSAESPTYDSLRTLIYHDATVTIDGTDRTVDVQDLEIEIANNVSLEARDKREPTKAFVGSREVTATATLDFENETLYRLFLGGSNADAPQDTLAEVGLNAKWVSPETIEDTTENYSLEFDLPNCRINTHDANLSEREMIAENVEFRAVFDATAGYEAQATLKNGVTSAY